MTATTTGTTAPAAQDDTVSTVLTPGPFDGLSTKAIQAELRRRKLASKSRDVRANPRAGHGQYYETSKVVGMVSRMIGSLRKRVAEGADIEALADLARIADEADGAVHEAVQQLRKSDANPQGYSWAEIGTALGYQPEYARQGAFTRYSKTHDGSQPSRTRRRQAPR